MSSMLGRSLLMVDRKSANLATTPGTSSAALPRIPGLWGRDRQPLAAQAPPVPNLRNHQRRVRGGRRGPRWSLCDLRPRHGPCAGPLPRAGTCARVHLQPMQSRARADEGQPGVPPSAADYLDRDRELPLRSYGRRPSAPGIVGSTSAASVRSTVKGRPAAVELPRQARRVADGAALRRSVSGSGITRGPCRPVAR